MKTTIALIALSLAFPAAAHARAAPDERPKMECCCMDKIKPMACCPEHGKPGEDEHQGHDPS